MAMSNKSATSRRRSWIPLSRAKHKDNDKDNDGKSQISSDTPAHSQQQHSASTRRSSFARFTRTQSWQSIDSADTSTTSTEYTRSPYSLPPLRPSSSSSLTTPTESSQQDAQDPRHYELERTISAPIQDVRPQMRSNTSSTSDLSPPSRPSTGYGSGSATFSKYSLASVLTLGLVRDKSDEGDRGRTLSHHRDSGNGSRRSSFGHQDSERERSRGRSVSPFRFRSRSRGRRDSSPSSVVEALSLDAESDSEAAPRVRPRNAFSLVEDDSDYGSDGSEESWSDADDDMDVLTAQHTEANAAVTSPVDTFVEADTIEPDPLGEGVNVIIPSEPYFPSTQFSSPGVSGSRNNPRRRKSTRVEKDLLPMTTSRPQFARDRCTITLVHGNPKHSVSQTNRVPRTYLVASDLSEESRYAVEWGIGTVLRDGDELMIVTVAETDSKLDPPEGGQVDRMVKLRSQQDRQTLAFLLVRQATGLLQRTKLHVTVICQAWHAKNAKHMLLDLIDYRNPTMVIVGSRGLTALKGILLGSTSHYLIQKSSVPVMVARRRLKRPTRKSAHLSPHRARVSLAEAAIDKVGPGRVDKDVEVLRDELQRDDAAREAVDLRLAGTDRGLAEDDEDQEEEGITG